MMASNEYKCFDLPKCSCSSSKYNIYDYPELKEMLPVDYDYTVCSWFKESEKYFECRFRVNVSTKEGALSWLESFKRLSNTSFTVDKTFAEDTKNLVYKVIMRCYRNTKPKSKVKQTRPQHTNCQARIVITVKQMQNSRRYRSTDVHLNDFPMIVLYYHKHNHDFNPIKALQKHSVHSEVNEIFIKYFEEGLNPSKAFEQYKNHLKEKYGDEYHKAIKDEMLLPKKNSVYKLYHSAFSKQYTKSKRTQMFESLETRVKNFNTEMNGRFSELKVFDDGNFVVVIVTPLMKRVLSNISEASDVLFMDSFNNADNYGSKVFTFLTKSCCGALPVCAVILSAYRKDVLSHALTLFKKFLTRKCFANRGTLGPKVFMVEDNVLVKDCISESFPCSTVVLNACLILRDAWKCLVNENVPLDRVQELYFKMKKMFYRTSEEELSLIYTGLKQSSSAFKLSNYISYVDKLYAKKEEWSKCSHYGVISTEEHVTNGCEQTMDVVEDNIFQMKKLYFAVNLFDYIVCDVNNFYKNKLMSLVNNESLSNTNNTFVDVSNYKEFQLLEYGAKSFKVRSMKGKRYYYVELDIGVCNCRIGIHGANCEHQSFVFMQYHGHRFTYLTADLKLKAAMLYIATGETDSLNSYLTDVYCAKDDLNQRTVSEMIILNPNTGTIFVEDDSESCASESGSGNFLSKQTNKIVSTKEFQECVKIFINQSENNPEMLLDAEQYENESKKRKIENSSIKTLKCFINNNVNSKHDSTPVVHLASSNDVESTVHSDISVKENDLMEEMNCNENSTSLLKPDKESMSTSPFIMYLSQN